MAMTRPISCAWNVVVRPAGNRVLSGSRHYVRELLNHDRNRCISHVASRATTTHFTARIQSSRLTRRSALRA
jgi:hypothetical protein